MGDVDLADLSPDQALESFAAAFHIFGDNPSGDEDHDRMLIGLYLDRASTFNELGRQSQALDDDRKAVTLAEGLVQKYSSSVQARRSLFEAYQRTVLPLCRKGRPERRGFRSGTGLRPQGACHRPDAGRPRQWKCPGPIRFSDCLYRNGRLIPSDQFRNGRRMVSKGDHS